MTCTCAVRLFVVWLAESAGFCCLLFSFVDCVRYLCHACAARRPKLEGRRITVDPCGDAASCGHRAGGEAARAAKGVARAGLAALRAALRAAAPFSKGGPSGGPFSVRAALILRVAALLPHGRPPRPSWAAHRPSSGHIRAALNLRVAALRAARRPRRGGPAARSGRPILGGGRPLLVGGPPDLAAGRPRWRQGGPLTTYGRFDHLPDTGS